MDLTVRFGAAGDGDLQVLWEDGERVFCRGWLRDADGSRRAVLAVLPAAEHPSPATLDRLAHEFWLRDDLDAAWAVRPLEFVRERGRTMLLLKDPNGELLEGLLGQPMAVGPFLHLALGLVAAIAGLHQRGLIHKDIKPAHLLVDLASGAVRLTGFGIASRLPRQRQAPDPPAVIAGTLAYMAPEQTGRMNRSIDARNDAFLRMVGQDREDLVAGRLRWTDLTPPEWRKRHEQVWTPEIRMTGTVQPYEKEYFRKDGSRVPVLVGAASFDESGKQGVSFVLDLTERKRAEAEARESEGRYRAVQMELAHANRVATMGQLSASIAHEVKQPIAATATDAAAALRWLGAQPPNLEEVRQALGRIVETSHRAGDVVGRIRALIKKAPPRKDRLDINEAIRELIELTRGEAARTGVSVQARLADGLPLIHGDRVQLQQVILNLIVNAVEAMSGVAEAPRELLITTWLAEPSGVLVSVRDSGPGLTPAALGHLFEAFYTTKPTGLGMGLSICRSIIEAHGGRLWVEANEPRGAIFQFSTPTQP